MFLCACVFMCVCHKQVWDTELHEEANKEMSATDLEATKQRVIKMM